MPAKARLVITCDDPECTKNTGKYLPSYQTFTLMTTMPGREYRLEISLRLALISLGWKAEEFKYYCPTCAKSQ